MEMKIELMMISSLLQGLYTLQKTLDNMYSRGVSRCFNFIFDLARLITRDSLWTVFVHRIIN